jgi:hypothetical protein
MGACSPSNHRAAALEVLHLREHVWSRGTLGATSSLHLIEHLADSSHVTNASKLRFPNQRAIALHQVRRSMHRPKAVRVDALELVEYVNELGFRTAHVSPHHGAPPH